MDLLSWGRSPWGEWVPTHVSWSLFWASLFAGVLFFVAHASYMLFSAHRKRTTAETDALETQYVCDAVLASAREKQWKTVKKVA